MHNNKKRLSPQRIGHILIAMVIENIKIVFGKNLRRIRVCEQMTQVTLADKAEVAANYIALLERGEKFPSAKTIERLAIVLKVESTEFFMKPYNDYSNPWGID